MTDLLFLSLEDWDDIWRRNQFVCATLARRHPEMKILFVGLQRHAPNLLRSGKFKAVFSESSRVIPEYPNITFTKPLRIAPDSTAWGLKINERLYRRHVRSMAHTLQLRNPILWINPHWAYHVPAHISHAATIYDITDDWTTLSQKELDRRRTIEADRLLCQSADATIVCSEKLRELKLPFVEPGRLHLLPNGVDAGHYAPVLQAGPIPPEIAALPRPVFGYTGTIHPDRVDVELLVRLSNLIKGSIALVGPSYLSAPERALLAATGNIHVFPAVPYAKIPHVMRGFDVSITPHRMTAFTESLNPIKLWEYLAAGKPIVSTDVAGFRDYPEHVRIAGTAEQFAAAMKSAAAEARSEDATVYSAARQAEARRHSWASRVDHIEAIMEQTLSRAASAARSTPAVQAT